MSGVSNGQLANENSFDNAFMHRNGNTNTVGIVALLNIAAQSGTSIQNIQRAINSLCSVLGMTNAEAHNFLYSWTSSIVGQNTDDVKERLEALTLKFAGLTGTGHSHNGTDGQGEKVSAANLANYNDLWVIWRKSAIFAGVTGTSYDVSSEFLTKSSGGNSLNVGVLTEAGINRVELIDTATNTYLEDTEGQRIYGKVTYLTGIWTLSFYKFESGSEVSHNFTSAVQLSFLYREVVTSENRPTIAANPFEFGTLDVTADVVDATPTQRGVVTTIAQAFAGAKTFNNHLEFLSTISGSSISDNTTTGANATLVAPSAFVHKLTNGSLSSILSIPAPTKSLFFILVNKTGDNVDLINSNTGATSILTGTDQDLQLQPNASVWMLYDISVQRWHIVGGSGSGGGGGIFFQETPAGTVNGTNATFGPLTYDPSNEDSILVMVDYIPVPKSSWAFSGGNIVFNAGFIPVAGQTVYVFYPHSGISATPVFSGQQKVEYRTLTAGEITAKQITLAFTPATSGHVQLDVQGASFAFYGDDFTVNTNILTWNGLGLDGILASGDKIRLSYVT